MQFRIELIPCNKELIQTVLKGDEHLSKCLKINVPPGWSEFDKELFKFARIKLAEDLDAEKWLAYLPILTKSKTLIGSCGFKGVPDKTGMVEIGYEVAKDYRNEGYATEMVKLLVDIAISDIRVKTVQANTLAEESSSTKVLEKIGFNHIDEYETEDGLVWNWQLKAI